MTSKPIRGGKGITRRQAVRLLGHPVCVVLQDGSYYIGKIAAVRGDQLVLAGSRGAGKPRVSVRRGKAVRVSGWLGGLMDGAGAFNSLMGAGGGGLFGGGAGQGAGGGLFGGGAGLGAGGGLFGGGAGLGAGGAAAAQAGAGAGAGGGWLGTFKQVWPHVTFGFKVIKQIMPLFGMFK
jgi:hypothetical protein